MPLSRPASCIIGWPVKHSRSPKLHGYWINRYKIDGEYRAEGVPPDDFPEFIRNLRAHGYVGANVTIPHKEMALALTEADDRARAVGASNTLWYEGDRLRSTNTDVEGFVLALDATAPGWDKRTQRAVVLGAGGAGRALVYGLIERGVPEIHIANRTHERAVEFRASFGPTVHPVRWEDLPRVIAGANLLANATALGLKGNPELEINLSPMAPGAAVADINYVPLRTKLIVDAERLGFRTSNGLDMLLYQAVRGFELWFGVRPEVTPEQRAMLVADIEGR